MPLIKYYTREVYGSRYAYILDPEIAKLVQMLTMRKTLSTNDMHALSGLGCTFQEVLRPDILPTNE